MAETWQFGNLQTETGEKTKGHLEGPKGVAKLPTFLINGEQEGPTVLILGGIHGCEYTSIDAALQLGRSLTPQEVKGRVAVVPIANPEAFYNRSIYVHPQDGKNLNRAFPGKATGTAAERLANFIQEVGIEQADYVIDLHGGDMIEALVPFTIYHVTEDQALNEQAQEMASLFGIKYAVGSRSQVPGSTYGSAANSGKVAVIAEAGQQGILDPAASQLLQDGTRNVLKNVCVLEGEVERGECQVLDVFDWYRADVQGLWYPAVQIGDAVESGSLIGKIVDEFGDTVQEYYADRGGVVLFLVTSLAINQNDPLLAVGA